MALALEERRKTETMFGHQLQLIGTTLTVEGVSKKGKNRVREHGKEWLVIKQDGNSVLLESFTSKYLRWMDLTQDKDFKRVESNATR
jgi:hypothetical protein